MSTRAVPLQELDRHCVPDRQTFRALGVMEDATSRDYLAALGRLTQPQVRQVIKRVLAENPAA